ncbi:MAG: hypothetical protein HKN26_05620, partial [Acidimicrobiales bacterium]|nr:hypothetical protein [Acidimicrobiales bacterium]
MRPLHTRFLALVGALTLLAAVLVQAPRPALAQNAAPVVTMYVPLSEDEIAAALQSMAVGSGLTIGSNIQTTISITVAVDGALVYYDHWEDGFESDIANPTAGSSQVWGDGDATNGIPPGYAVDVLNAGSVIVLDNGGTLATPRTAAVEAYDGRDKIAATRGIALTRAGWEATYGTLHAGSVAAFDTTKFGTNFTFPIGENIASNFAFQYTGASIMATQDGTTVELDTNGDGTPDQTAVLNEGQTLFANGGISAGGTVTADAPVQVHLMTGDVGATFEGRWYELFPDNLVSDSYVAATGTTEVGNEPAIFLFNPGSSAITVDITLSTGPDSVVVPAGGTVSYLMPNGSGGRFES